MAKKGFLNSLFGGSKGGKGRGGSRSSGVRSSSSKARSSASSKRTSSSISRSSKPGASRPAASKQTKTPPKTSTTNNKNVSKRYPNGRTLKTKDKYLPIDRNGKSTDPKDERWVAVIDSNRKDELAVVRLTTQKQANTTSLPTYKKGNRKESFFKHFVEIEDRSGDPIKVDEKKFKENPKKNYLTTDEVLFVRDKVLGHVKQSSENNRKIATLKENGDV